MVEQSEENNVENDRREALATIAKLEKEKNKLPELQRTRDALWERLKEARDSLIVIEREYSRARIRLNTEVDRISRGIGQAKKVLQKTANPELKNLLDTLRAEYSEKMMTSDGPATTPTFTRQEKVTQITEINERRVAFERGYKALIQKIQNAQLELDPDVRELKNQMAGFLRRG